MANSCIWTVLLECGVKFCQKFWHFDVFTCLALPRVCLTFVFSSNYFAVMYYSLSLSFPLIIVAFTLLHICLARFSYLRGVAFFLKLFFFFYKIEDSQRGNEAISGNCEIDRSVLFLLWTSAPLSLFTLWPSPENSSLVSHYNLISRTRKIDDSTTETANIRKATCTTSNDFACNPNASIIWLIDK